ncbi:hypothetical protein OROMI_009651 [Orobanche minor]
MDCNSQPTSALNAIGTNEAAGEANQAYTASMDGINRMPGRLGTTTSSSVTSSPAIVITPGWSPSYLLADTFTPQTPPTHVYLSPSYLVTHIPPTQTAQSYSTRPLLSPHSVPNINSLGNINQSTLPLNTDLQIQPNAGTSTHQPLIPLHTTNHQSHAGAAAGPSHPVPTNQSQARLVTPSIQTEVGMRTLNLQTLNLVRSIGKLREDVKKSKEDGTMGSWKPQKALRLLTDLGCDLPHFACSVRTADAIVNELWKIKEALILDPGLHQDALSQPSTPPYLPPLQRRRLTSASTELASAQITSSSSASVGTAPAPELNVNPLNLNLDPSSTTATELNISPPDRCNIDLGCVKLENLRLDNNLQDLRAKIFPYKRMKVRAPEVASPVTLPARRRERSRSSLVVSTPRVSTQSGMTGRRSKSITRKASRGSSFTIQKLIKKEDNSMEDHHESSSSPEMLNRSTQNLRQSSAASEPSNHPSPIREEKTDL